MDNRSLAYPAHSPTRLQEIAEAVEKELERLRRARPYLAERLDRAAGLLVTHLSCPPRTRPVRVRIGADGSAEHGAWLPASEDDLYCPCCGVEGEA